MIKINVVHIIIKVLVYTTISKNTHTHTVETGKRNKKKAFIWQKKYINYRKTNNTDHSKNFILFDVAKNTQIHTHSGKKLIDSSCIFFH